MDRPQPVSDDLKVVFDNLEKLNRLFGSYNLIRHFLRRWIAPGESVTLLDLCTGSGDIPRCIADWARAQKFDRHNSCNRRSAFNSFHRASQIDALSRDYLRSGGCAAL
jgi:hypothetical protein